VNLKAKLCILKNYTLLLLGPSSFEQWCESCPCFTVRPLSFLLFIARSSIFLLESPSSPIFPAACACLLPQAAPERLQLCFLRPRVVLSSLPPPVSFPLSSPRRATLGCQSRALATHRGSPTPPAVVGSVRDHSLLLSLSFLPVESCFPYKTQLSSILLLFLPLSSSLQSPAPKRRRTSSAGILPNRTTPPRFRWPRASSPPPLVP
jgi:hypothetical protein